MGRKAGGEVLHDLLLGAERMGRLQQVTCHRAGNGTRGLDLQEMKEKWSSSVSPSGARQLPHGLPGKPAGVGWGLGEWGEWREVREELCDPLQMGAESIQSLFNVRIEIH